MGRLRPKGVRFSPFGYTKGRDFTRRSIWKGRDFKSWGIWKRREICHLGMVIENSTNAIYGCFTLFIKHYIKMTRFPFLALFPKYEAVMKACERDTFFSKGYTKRVPFMSKWYNCKTVSGRNLPVQNFIEYPPPRGLNLSSQKWYKFSFN